MLRSGFAFPQRSIAGNTIQPTRSTQPQPFPRPFLLPRQGSEPNSPARKPQPSGTANVINSDKNSIMSNNSQGSGLPSTETRRIQRYQPFCPLPGDLDTLKVPAKPGERCPKCNSNIVLNPLRKQNGEIIVEKIQPGQIITLERGVDADGNSRMVDMVWSCRINKHPYLYSDKIDNPGSHSGELDTERPPATGMSLAGVERWVNEIRGLMANGSEKSIEKAKDAMMQVVLMNEGKKKESFSWLERERANKLASALQGLPKSSGKDAKAKDGREAEEEKRVLNDLLSKENTVEIYSILSSLGEVNYTTEAKKYHGVGELSEKKEEDDIAGLEYAGIALDSYPGNSSSGPTSGELPSRGQVNGEQEIIGTNPHYYDAIIPKATDTKGNIGPTSVNTDQKHGVHQFRTSRNQRLRSVPSKTTIGASIKVGALTSPVSPLTQPKEEPTIPRISQNRFSLSHLFSGLSHSNKTSPTTKRHDNVLATTTSRSSNSSLASRLPLVKTEPLSLQEMLSEPFDRIAEGVSLKDNSSDDVGPAVDIPTTSASSTNKTSDAEDVARKSFPNASDHSISIIEMKTPSFITDKSNSGSANASVIEKEESVAAVAAPSEIVGKRSVSASTTGTNRGIGGDELSVEYDTIDDDEFPGRLINLQD
ncbi:hypothetical protein ABW20_dc0110029 [Dactylellina cionopaga]|nr:hypothetical protein ABW20_dc0110029 [Dactylellina cionopaga]